MIKLHGALVRKSSSSNKNSLAAVKSLEQSQKMITIASENTIVSVVGLFLSAINPRLRFSRRAMISYLARPLAFCTLNVSANTYFSEKNNAACASTKMTCDRIGINLHFCN